MRPSLMMALLLGLSGCAYYEPPPPVAVGAPPPPVAEVVPPPPAAYYVWRPGHWRWNGFRWVWIRGHYAARMA